MKSALEERIQGLKDMQETLPANSPLVTNIQTEIDALAKEIQLLERYPSLNIDFGALAEFMEGEE